jgi:hypothetical protein
VSYHDSNANQDFISAKLTLACAVELLVIKKAQDSANFTSRSFCFHVQLLVPDRGEVGFQVDVSDVELFSSFLGSGNYKNCNCWCVEKNEENDKPPLLPRPNPTQFLV